MFSSHVLILQDLKRFALTVSCVLRCILHNHVRHGACIIEGRPVEPTELHTVFGWPNLQMRRDYLKCILVYKSLHAMAPAYLLTEFRHAHQIHTYNTRHRDLLRLPLAKTVKYQGSFRYNGARTFNALPLNVRLSQELGEFKTKTKRHFKRC